MKRLLQIEFLKLWKNRASRVLTISYFVLLSFIALIASIKFDIGHFNLHLAEMGIFNFPYIWHFNTYVADWLNFFLAIVIVSMVANEYSYGTLKQNLIDGLSKKEFLASKLLMVGAFSVIITLYVFVMSLILGLAYSSYTEWTIVFSDMEYLLAFFLKLLAYFSLCLFLGILVKRSAFALGFLIVLYIVEGIFHGIIGVNFGNEMRQSITQFFPMSSMAHLIHEPFSRLSLIKSIGNQIGVDTKIDYGVSWLTVIVVLIWISFFVWASYRLLKKRDL